MMDMIAQCYEVFINFIQGFLISYFFCKFLTFKKSTCSFKNAGLGFGVIVSLLICLFNQITGFEHFAIFIYVAVSIIFSLIFFQGKILYKVMISIIPFAVIAVITTCMTNIMSVLSQNALLDVISQFTAFRAVVLLLTQLLTLYVFQIIIISFSTNKMELNPIEKWLIVFILFISIVIAAFLNLVALGDIKQESRLYILLADFGLVLINIGSYNMILNSSRKNTAVSELEFLKTKQIYQEQYIQNVKSEYETIRKIRHDVKGDFTALYTLLAENKVGEAMNHIEKNVAPMNVIQTFVATNNHIVNAVVNSKATIAKSFGIQINCLIVSNFDGIDDVDLCNLLGNMFENAIAACGKCEKENKEIYLKIRGDDSKCSFVLKNSIAKSVLEENPRLQTTKKDRDDHGYGVKIIRDISRKYMGDCDYYEENNLFCCSVTLRKKKTAKST